MATTQSLAELTQIALSISSTDKVSLGSSQIWEPPIEAAFSEHGTESVKEIFWFEIASIIRRMLITLVTEAGRNCSWMLWLYKIWPVFCSIKIALPHSKLRELFSSVLLVSVLEFWEDKSEFAKRESSIVEDQT